MTESAGTEIRKRNYLLVIPRLVLNIGDGYSFPLGLPYISSSMKKAGFNVTTLNLNHHAGDVFDILNRVIEEHAIDAVVTGGLSFQYNTVKRVIEAAKQHNPEIVTIVGGGIVTSDPETAMIALEYADFGVVGEGEITIGELCRAIENRGDFAGIDGLIFRNGQGFTATGPRREMDDIDSIPWPDYEGFELEKFFDASPSISGLNRKNTVFMISSRSCPFNCTFCFHTTGKRYRQRSLDSFFEELEYMVSRYNIEYICLADELFARDVERVKEFCRRIRKFGLKWWAQFRVDNITPELLAILKEGGCDVMSFGLESADNRILKSMRKGTTVEQIERALKLVYDAGISLEGAFIFGDIEETWETATATLNWWRNHAEYKINLNLITVYPGSYLYTYACEKGIIADKVQFLKDGCPQVRVSKLTDDEYSTLVSSIMEAPMTLAKVLSTIEVANIDYKTARMDVRGVCTACRHPNYWDNVKFFTTNFLGCRKCGQRYNAILPPQLREAIDTNITGLLARYGKVAIWGINYHTADLFRHSTALQSTGVFPLDISEAKRKMDLYGKDIFAPDTIKTENIEAVIVAIPVYFSQIEGQIKSNYKNVRAIIDLCRLIDPEFECGA